MTIAHFIGNSYLLQSRLTIDHRTVVYTCLRVYAVPLCVSNKSDVALHLLTDSFHPNQSTDVYGSASSILREQ